MSNPSINRNFFTLRQLLFSMQRIGRLANIYLLVFYGLIVPWCTLLFIVLLGEAILKHSSVTFWTITAILIVTMWITLTTFVHIRRSHDIGRSGWFSVLLWVPLLFIYPTIVLFFFRGEQSVNKYGNECRKISRPAHCFFISLIIFFTGLFSITAYYESKWQRYDNIYYSVKLPVKPTSKPVNINGIIGNELDVNTKDIWIQTCYANLNHANAQALQLVFSTSKPQDMLSWPPRKLLENVRGSIVIDKIISSTKVRQNGADGLEIFAKAHYKKTPMVFSYAIFIRHKIVYEMIITTSDKYHDEDITQAKKLFDSFRFIDKGFY